MKTHSGHHETCESCKRTHYVGQDEYTCDECGSEVDGFFHMTVFFDQEAAQDMHFCNWKCLLKKLPEVKCDSSINLPYLHYDADAVSSGMHVRDFLKAIGGKDE